MIYSTELANKNKPVVSSNNTKYLEAGIHENVKLVGVRTAESINGNIFIEIRFEKDGKELIHTEWEPTLRPNETEEQVQTKATNQVTRLTYILNCFYPKEMLTFAGSSYKEFAAWVVGLLSAADKNKLLRVKVIYNDKGYTALPSYKTFAFIEPMEIPMGYYEEGKNDSRITEIKGIDRFVRPIIADTEKKEDNPLAAVETPTVSPADDLPF